MAKVPPPKTFFLNERHELSRGEREGGGRAAQYGVIDWAAKSARLGDALRKSQATIRDSKDPLKDRHYFLCAMPATVPKISKAKNATREYTEETQYSGEHSRVFRRLGLDLIDVSPGGVATVHATADRMERLVSTAQALRSEKAQEQARWVTIDSFKPVPREFRIDDAWLQQVAKDVPSDVIVELQPLLGRVEVEVVLAALARGLVRVRGEALTGTGTDFSGRKWFRGRMCRASLAEIAENFLSVQSLHPPHVTPVSAGSRTPRVTGASSAAQIPPHMIAELPTVAVVDTGVPAGHPELAPYRRGAYQSQDGYGGYAGDHGSFVASRVVWGDLDFGAGEEPRPPGTCQFFDVIVAKDGASIDDKAVLPALEAVVATNPDVRVFNLSFGEVRPLASYSDIVEQREHLLTVQDLDNFVFARDVIVVVAAGNSPRGIVPKNDYPKHIDEPVWQLAAWPSGFNTLTCGATVEALHPEGKVKALGWPSPLTRVGPGIAAAPKPEFGAHGGNLDDDWKWRPGLGVWVCTAGGIWEDHAGTSFAAPLLAREAALTFQQLQRFCPQGAKPFGVMVKAFLTLTASRVDSPLAVEALARRTIGNGTADRARLTAPRQSSAVFLWQGVIDGPNDKIRVQLPVPIDWLKEASGPKLRLVCCWDTPVNEATRDLWASRHVSVQLRPAPDEKALPGSRARAHGSYPVIDRTYDLSREKIAKLVPSPTQPLWDLEISYDQIAEYYPGITFAPQQRVAFAAELWDDAAEPVSPQAAIQSLPVAASMTRLAVPSAPLQVPLILRRTT